MANRSPKKYLFQMLSRVGNVFVLCFPFLNNGILSLTYYLHDTLPLILNFEHSMSRRIYSFFQYPRVLTLLRIFIFHF